jgi:hypothetical protein
MQRVSSRAVERRPCENVRVIQWCGHVIPLVRAALP